ncbi:MAG: hypothetical protein ACM3WV_09705 [Bacillota bacterium]
MPLLRAHGLNLIIQGLYVFVDLRYHILRLDAVGKSHHPVIPGFPDEDLLAGGGPARVNCAVFRLFTEPSQIPVTDFGQIADNKLIPPSKLKSTLGREVGK